VFEIERIFPNSAVQCIAVYTGNDESLWQLSQKHCQDKYLLNHVDLKIKLRRSWDAFALVADAANYKIKIKEMALYVRKVQLNTCLGPSIFSLP
jgi:hypothetical protein